MSFEPFQYLGQKKRVESAGATQEVPTYQEPAFKVGVSTQEADKSHRKGGHFHLDSTVAGQLGIDEHERRTQETKIEKEIARRWERASEQAEAAGYTKGLEEGKAEAYKAELPRIAEKLDKLDALIHQLDAFRESIFSANESFLMDLIARVAGMVALKEVELDKDYVKRVVLALLQQIGQKDDLKIYLSEADTGNIEGLRAAAEKEHGKLTNTVIETNPEIPAGGCKIETRFGVVDASVATQIENVMKALKAQ